MRMLVIANIWPHSGHTVRAANVMVYEMVRALAGSGRGTIGYLKVSRASDPMQTAEEHEGVQTMTQAGIEVLQELRLPAPLASRPLWAKLFFPQRADYYPDSIHADLAAKAIDTFKPDIVLIPWSDWVTALCAELPHIKFAYYGNPDHKAGIHRLRFDRRHGICKYSRLRSFIYLRWLEAAHLKIMKRYEILGNVAANDAIYYQKKGHPNAFYIQNMWIDRFGPQWKTMRSESKPAKIVASLGQLGGTANRYGLEILGRELAPLLRQTLAGIPYELHIYGKGELPATVQVLLNSPEIKFRGFVDDIDREMLECTVFLCLNNGSPYKVGHTRYLHAWTLGCCVVAHHDASLSMPEIEHGKNALLGSTTAEIAAHIKQAIEKPELRESLGRGGYETFRSNFTAETVVKRLWQAIDHFRLG